MACIFQFLIEKNHDHNEKLPPLPEKSKKVINKID